MKKFESIAFLVKNARRKMDISQAKLATEIGFNHGQFISNLERGLCGLPINKIKITANVLGLEEPQIINAMVSDFERNIKRELYSESEYF